jgi:hypothetical protein
MTRTGASPSSPAEPGRTGSTEVHADARQRSIVDNQAVETSSRSVRASVRELKTLVAGANATSNALVIDAIRAEAIAG